MSAAGARGAPTAGAGPAPAGARRQEDKGLIASLTSQLPAMLLMFVVSQWAMNKIGPQAPPKTPVAVPNVAPGSAPAVPVPVQEYLSVPIWPLGTPLDVYVSLSTQPTSIMAANALKKGKDKVEMALPRREWKGVPFGQWDWNEKWDVDFAVPTSVQHNGSLWLDLTVAPSGTTVDPSAKGYDPLRVHRRRKLVSRYLKQRRIRKVKNLLSGANETAAVEEEAEEPETKEVPIVSYWHPNVTIGLVTDVNPQALNKLPPVLTQHVDRVPTNEVDPNTGHHFHYPIAFFNDFWLLREQMMPINETVSDLSLQVTVYPLSYWKFQLLASMSDAFEKQADTGGGGEIDEIKRMLTETAPWLLITTMIVSLLHTLFEFLAFSSDVKHWRGKKELVGVSIRTILTNVFVQLVIMLYLLDNNENTSWMILLGQGVGLLIEAWKITKAVDIKLVQIPGRMLPKLDIKDKHVLSEDEKKTQEYDRLAFKYVAWATAPCLAGYTIYSLMYQTHRGWYSFVLSTLTSFVYAFGFVQLIPQLIINYKLKSVAHLPMKTLVYKFLTTIVDDFFSFCIKMPMLHRLACFRDDVVFVILLYQYAIYRVDMSRVNEYGQGGGDATAIEKDDAGESKKTR